MTGYVTACSVLGMTTLGPSYIRPDSATHVVIYSAPGTELLTAYADNYRDAAEHAVMVVRDYDGWARVESLATLDAMDNGTFDIDDESDVHPPADTVYLMHGTDTDGLSTLATYILAPSTFAAVARTAEGYGHLSLTPWKVVAR